VDPDAGVPIRFGGLSARFCATGLEIPEPITGTALTCIFFAGHHQNARKYQLDIPCAFDFVQQKICGVIAAP